jgi:hypothetical protein
MLIQDIVGNHYPFHPFILYIQVQTIVPSYLLTLLPSDGQTLKKKPFFLKVRSDHDIKKLNQIGGRPEETLGSRKDSSGSLDDTIIAINAAVSASA